MIVANNKGTEEDIFVLIPKGKEKDTIATLANKD